MRIVHLSKRQRQKAQDAILKAKAQSDARKAVHAALDAVNGPERERTADALLEAIVIAHATVCSPAATSSLFGRQIGRLTTPVPTTTNQAAEAVFRAVGKAA